ncbi:MAG: acyloxyacyl hydrolase [Legionellaceae bacterium]|nr:acyloxyacyl hydrolase [Legionellaceae bacterium]
MGEVQPSFKKVTPVIAFQGGYACLDASKRQARFVGSDDNLFSYMPSASSCDTGFYGAFLGGERFLRDVASYPIWLQAGFEYDGFGQVDISGTNAVGVDAASSTVYKYRYAVGTQQILASMRLFTTTYHRLHPYGEAGIGIALNHASAYQATTRETGNVNVTPNFSNHSTTKLSYILGLGLDAQLTPHLRCGLGYRYSYFGTASLDNGAVSTDTATIPVAFNVSAPNLYANQLLARATYVI